MDNLFTFFTEGEGYIILKDIIPTELINNLIHRIPDLYPVRASSADKEYAERDDISSLNSIAVWWSQSVLDLPEAKEIEELIGSLIRYNFQNMRLYSSDVVFVNPYTNYVNPHVDTPHRFKQYNFNHKLLGIQCIIPLVDFTIESGSTGVVPFSQKRDFDIDHCYAGKFDRWFLENAKQEPMEKGSILIYNSRVLHSSMPNSTNNIRPALLINYCDVSIIDNIRNYDNIWKSNA